MDDQNGRGALSLTQSEYKSIDEFRKKKNTAVLTIMFTDIQGFTALTESRGETYVHRLHEEHDRILVGTIEEEGAGVVIKFIGDSVMAVFSEPTAAADKALRIQRRLREFNLAHPELDDILVRIGLHMGQTVIENKMQTDLFGRHVNKASRVESLAAGGHVYASYPVFDSVKSWLLDSPTAGSKLHGSYRLKGIDRPEEIYEIFDKDVAEPRAPKGAKRAGRLSPAIPIAAAVAAAIVLAGAFVLSRGTPGASGTAAPAADTALPEPEAATGTAASPSAQGEADASVPTRTDGGAGSVASGTESAKSFKSASAAAPAAASPAAQSASPVPASPPPDVWFLGLYAREPILDFGTPLAVTVENADQGLAHSLNDIGPGKHVIHYVVAAGVRYFSEFEAKGGKNVIPLKFYESYLPSAQVNFTYKDESTAPVEREGAEGYFFHDRKTMARIDRSASVRVSARGSPTGDGKAVHFDVGYSLTVDGSVAAERSFTVESPLDAADMTRPDALKVFEDAYHAYYLKYSYKDGSIQVALSGAFKD